MRGFAKPSDSEALLNLSIKRIEPAAKRGDIHAFADGVRKCGKLHGTDIADRAMCRMLDKYDDLCIQAIGMMPKGMEQQIQQISFGIVADVIEKAGLRIEQHYRVSDQGIALTHAAVAAIEATGFTQIHKFGSGNASIEGMGIDRDPFMHPLADAIDVDGINEALLNNYAVASMAINVAAGWVEGSQERAIESLKSLVFAENPNYNVEDALRQARYDDRVLMRLANLAAAGMDKRAGMAYDKRRT